MARVRYRISIGAPPEKVFDLISRVEDFVRYSKAIKDIREVAPRTYRWTVRFFGITMGWDAAVTEFTPPGRFAWASKKGVYNRGSYTLSPDGKGTLVDFELEYRLTGVPVLNFIATPFASAVVSLLYREVLENIKKALVEKPG